MRGTVPRSVRGEASQGHNWRGVKQLRGDFITSSRPAIVLFNPDQGRLKMSYDLAHGAGVAHAVKDTTKDWQTCNTLTTLIAG